MPDPRPEDSPAPSRGPDDEVPATDPAHRAALLVMVATPLVLGAAVYAVLKLLSG